MPLNDYRADLMGSAEITPDGAFEVGSWQSYTLTYTAGKFGIDDRGSIKIALRAHCDATPWQMDDPKAPGYVSVETSTGIPLTITLDDRRAIRPWNKSIFIRCNKFLSEGDQIIVRFGDTREGSPGLRVQTFVEDRSQFRVFVDAIATYDYTALPEEKQPYVTFVATDADVYQAVLPTLRNTGEGFKLAVKAEDRWGNPTDKADQVLSVHASMPVEGLPESITLKPGEFGAVIRDLKVFQTGQLSITLKDSAGETVAVSNPMCLQDSGDYKHFWSDMHGQSEETIGNNPIERYFEFARDKAHLDIVGHQGNDFQITKEFWTKINDLSAEYNQDGEFLALPGYEWSGNTSVGGDHNVWYRHEGRPIHRSSRTMIADRDDNDTDCHTSADLFEALKHEDAIVTAHVGGRYADVKYAHNAKVEPSVEVHSAWGSFEWIVQDAFESNYRVGIVASSDGHDGRPGACYPGDAKFGSYGGLTCHLIPSLDRDAFFEGFRRRHHYATTGARMYLDLKASFASPSTLFMRNPDLGDVPSVQSQEAIIGDIVKTTDDEVTLNLKLAGTSPITMVQIRDGMDVIETIRCFEENPSQRRIRIVCEGAEYRGRGRLVQWEGAATVEGRRITRTKGVNFFNPDRQPGLDDNNTVHWKCVSTGGFSGIDIWVDEGVGGTLKVRTNQINCDIELGDITAEKTVFKCGGLEKALKISALPAVMENQPVELTRTVKLRKEGDTRLYVRVAQEDGHRAWSSPIYIFK